MPKGTTEKKPGAAKKASRPRIAEIYGVPKNSKGLLDWAHVQQRMTEARVYWIASASATGKPHATPVDGMWLDDALYFGGDPSTRRNRNLQANPAVSVHLESGSDVVILEGNASPIVLDLAMAQRLADASNAKYGYGFTAESFMQLGMYFVLRPRVVFAWKQFPQDVTRWELDA